MRTTILMFVSFTSMIAFFGCDKKEDLSSKGPKLSFVLEQDNSYSTFLRCVASDGTISCGGQPEVVPTFGAVSAYRDLENSSLSQIANQADGCYLDMPKGEPSVILDNNNKQCRLSARVYKGDQVTGVPWLEWTDPGISRPFSGTFPYLNLYTMDLVNTDDLPECELSLLVQERPGYGQFTNKFLVAPGRITFSSLFSLQVDPSMSEITTASKNAPFTFKYIPAINSSELIAAGITDASINDFLTPHLGDFLILNFKDKYGHSGYCRKTDAIIGSIEIPASIMSRFNGTTSFVVSRYKIIKRQLTENSELVTTFKVGMFTAGTDAYGQVNGQYSVWVQQ